MELLNSIDIFNMRPVLSFWGGEYFTKYLLHVLRFERLNKKYGEIGSKSGIDFIDEVIRGFEFKIDFDEKELKRIPEKGPVIVVANHPYGGLEALLLIKYLSIIRPDVKVVASALMKKIENVSDFFIRDDTFDNQTRDTVKETAGEMLKHLKNNGVLCMFPNKEGTTYDIYNNVIDQVWQFNYVRFIKKAEVPVVPIYFKGSNSRLLQLFAKIHPNLRKGKLPLELLGKKFKSLIFNIGNAIRVEDQQKINDPYKFGRFIRAKTYSMGSNIEVKRFFSYSLKPKSKPQPIADPIPKELILKEIEFLKNDYALFKLKNYVIYSAPANVIPNILNEIGRLREITFREVGEGTNHSIDIDEFDLYYNQMFIWDEIDEKLVGAYRLGLGKDILAQYGKRGFYLHTLFRIYNSFIPVLEESVELGRSFVVKEYQRKPLPLFLLWKGILYFLLKNPEYRYLIGPVSISNNYSKVSKDLIIKFIMANHVNRKMARGIKPRKNYKFKSDNAELNILMENMDHDINKLDKIIGDVDVLNTGLPVLLKKYIKQNAKIIGFNVDPKFNNCLDGLIVLDVNDIPQKTIESLSKEVNDGSILERFYSSRE